MEFDVCQKEQTKLIQYEMKTIIWEKITLMKAKKKIYKLFA